MPGAKGPGRFSYPVSLLAGSAAAAVAVAAAAAATSAAAAAEDEDDQDNDPQAASVAPTVVTASHIENDLLSEIAGPGPPGLQTILCVRGK